MEKRVRKRRFVFADFHMADGREKDGKPNNLELFEADAEFYDAVELLIATYGDAPMELNLLGDFFDFLRAGRADANPTEDAAIAQIERIFAAHPLVIEAMRQFLHTGGNIKFFIGNHDLALVWANVQNFIRRELTKGFTRVENIEAWKRIKVVKKEEECGALFEHGNDAEFIHATPKNPFLTKRLGKPLLLPLLRQPLGNYFVADQANVLSRGTRFFKGNRWVGRLEPHWYLYLESLFRNKWFAFCAIVIWFLTPFRYRLFRPWWVRKSAGVWTLFRHNWASLVVSIYNMLRGRDYTTYAKELLANNNGVNVVFIAHNHNFARHTTKDGTVICVGNWSETYDGQPLKPELNWRRLKWLEKIIKYFLEARKLFIPAARERYSPKKREVYSFGMCEFFDDGSKRSELMRYNPKEKSLEEIY